MINLRKKNVIAFLMAVMMVLSLFWATSTYAQNDDEVEELSAQEIAEIEAEMDAILGEGFMRN